MTGNGQGRAAWHQVLAGYCRRQRQRGVGFHQSKAQGLFVSTKIRKQHSRIMGDADLEQVSRHDWELLVEVRSDLA
jgi:hypothetical protein